MRSNLQPLVLYAAAFSTLARATPITRQQTSPNPLAKRTITGLNCGLFATADWENTNFNLGNLQAKGDLAVPVAAGQCNRVGCYNTSGVYVCNAQDVDITVNMATDVVNQLQGLINACGELPYDGGFSSGAFSGQIFDDTYGGFNVDVAFCDENEGDTFPSQYAAPGPNGSPFTTCGGNTGIECSLNQACDPGSIVMTSQESVTCNKYMGPVYIGALATYTYSTTRSIGTTWTVGGFLGIDSSDLAPVSVNAGFLGTFAETTTTGDVAGTSQQCGTVAGNWTCGMEISPTCWQMTGTCSVTQAFNLGVVPWGTTMPQTDGADGQSIYTPNLCVCQNCPGATDVGVPSTKCDLDCATCDTPPGGT